MSVRCFLEGVGVWSPGLCGWTQAAAVLRGAQAYEPVTTALPVPTALHAAERRRAPATVKLAMQVAGEACAMAQVEPAQLPSVFASSHGDTEISDYMCTELAQSQPALSPTRFHNSVHNAASGYWTIAMQCMQAANAISAGTDSFGAGLLEAALLLQDAPQALLVAYDMAAPTALLPLCPIPQSFAAALVLSRQRTERSVAAIALTAAADAAALTYPDFVPALMAANPTARSLPLLSVLANKSAACLEFAGQHWTVAPC